MGVSIGTLIIGSLYWDPEPNRARWRSERLDLAASRNVFAPIRYGRRSDSRGNSYTMVFSEALTRQEPHMGCAIAIPCARPVHSIQALVEEAQHLWAAERTRDSFNGRISADWGCIALALNPSRCVPQELVDGWSHRVFQEVGYGRLCRAEDEGEIVNASGFLIIPWPPRTDGLPLELDALLATATDPTIVDGQYPSVQEIASAWKQSTGEAHVEYF